MVGHTLMPTPEAELSFAIKGMTLRAKAWGNPTDNPVLALHGRLDNCHSFKPLASLLKGIYLVAIDLAGHGKSDYRSLDSGYNAWQDVPEIFAIADALGFERFGLLGHSRGAFISHLCAGTYPERITGVVLIDGFAPPDYADPYDAPQQLAGAIRTDKRFARHKRHIHSSVEEAVKNRSTGQNFLSESAAFTLAERGMKEVAGGVAWSSDPRLQADSDFKLTREHTQAFVDRVACPVRVLLADTPFSGLLNKAFVELAGNKPNYSLVQVGGTHHLHMEAETIEQAGSEVTELFKSCAWGRT